MSVQCSAPSYNRVSLAMLGTSVLPAKSEPYERVSAALAVRAAIGSTRTPRTLLFLLPEGTSSTARYVLAGLLAGNHAHQHGAGVLPVDECRAFLTAQILFITPVVSECISDLHEIHLASTTVLTDLWKITRFTRNTHKTSSRQRILVANPGWASARMQEHKYSAVVIDATHPRTLHQLPQLLRLSRDHSSYCVVVAPVLPPALMSQLGTNETDVWIWDPLAQTNAKNAVGDKRHPIPPIPTHSFYICTEDSEGDHLLDDAYREIASATKLANGRTYPGLPLVWSILNKLRTLTVPLTTYDEVAGATYGRGLTSRMRMLDEISGHGDAIWDASWPRIRMALDNVFAAFLKRTETAKFWVLAERLDSLLRSRHDLVRLVAPSKVEVELLTNSLQDVVDTASESIADGRLEITTYRDDAIRVSQGQPAFTLLLGMRPFAYRHLNVYPSHPQEQILYPFEADIARHSIEHQYIAAEALQGPSRLALLERLHFSAIKEIALPQSPAPQFQMARVDGKPVTISRPSDITTDLDIDWHATNDDAFRLYSIDANDDVPRTGEVVDITFAGGYLVRYPVDQKLDVYYEETEVIERVPAAELQPGMRIVRFVDGHYDSLFQRTAEAIQNKLPVRERMALELWNTSKRNLARNHNKKLDLYESLCARGLKSTYTTCQSWFKDEDDTIAPRTFADFVVIAKATNSFKTEKLIDDVFRCIQKVRGRHRSAGRQLHALLRAVVSSDGYDDALESIRKVDPDLADVFSAVDVAEIERVQRG